MCPALLSTTPVPQPKSDLAEVFAQVAREVLGENAAGFEPAVRASKHADFQINGALPLAKALGRNPRDLAADFVAALGTHHAMFDRVEVAGPGFINCTLSTTYLGTGVASLERDPQLGIPQATSPQTYVVDYAGPNIAKSMHVGHLRTCIIGDAFVRVFEALGHRSIRQDHQGDWGTQFGMLIEHLIDSGDPVGAANSAVHDLDGLYKAARTKFDGDEQFASRSRERVVLLQQGDKETLALWQLLVDISRKYFHKEYAELGVLITETDARGESFYNDMLDDVIEDLENKGLAKEDDGALCVYPEGFKGRDGEPFAFIVRKSDGGYNYATTDLAALRYSIDVLNGTRLLYVTDVRQSQHFAMIFAVGASAGWVPDTVTCTHVGYGAVTGADGKPYKTRSGKTVRLGLLLDEAIERAAIALTERTLDCPDSERAAIARAVGVGAVKWADLKNECKNNYVFDLDRMLAFQGNTGPYIQYASTRAKSVLRKAAENNWQPGTITISQEAERQLAITLLLFGSVVQHVANVYEPHHLCAYLFELAERFTTFYEHCPVLKAEDDVARASRLRLCQLVHRVLDRGLNLLGIEAVEHM